MQALTSFSGSIGVLFKEDLSRWKGILINISLREMSGEDSRWATALFDRLCSLFALELHAFKFVKLFRVIPMMCPIGVAKEF